MVYGSLEKAKNSLDNNQVYVNGGMQKLTDLINDKANIWSCQSNILKGTYKILLVHLMESHQMG